MAEPLNSICKNDRDYGDEREHRPKRAADDLWPAAAMVTRGSLADTFGQVTTPAAMHQGEPLELLVDSGDDEAVINLEPLGTVPTSVDTVSLQA